MSQAYVDTFGGPGISGPDGPAGTPGPSGPSGPIGLQAPRGPSGPSGASGVTGVSGPSGATGPTFIPSVVNPLGSSQTIVIVGGPSGLAYSTGPSGPPWVLKNVNGLTKVNCIASSTSTTATSGEQLTTYVVGGVGGIVYRTDPLSSGSIFQGVTIPANVFGLECSKVVWSPFHKRFIAVGIREFPVSSGSNAGRYKIGSAWSSNGIDWTSDGDSFFRGTDSTPVRPYGCGRGIVSDLECNGAQTIVTANTRPLSVTNIKTQTLGELFGGRVIQIYTTNTEFIVGDKFILSNLVPSNLANRRIISFLSKNLHIVIFANTTVIRILYPTGDFGVQSDDTDLITGTGTISFPESNWYSVSNNGGSSWADSTSTKQLVINENSIPGGIINDWNANTYYIMGDIVRVDSSYTVPPGIISRKCQYWTAARDNTYGRPGADNTDWYPSIWDPSYPHYRQRYVLSIGIFPIIYIDIKRDTVWYNGFKYTLRTPTPALGVPPPSSLSWQQAGGRNVKDITSNLIIKSIRPYYRNEWLASLENKASYTGRGGNAIIGTTVRDSYLYATVDIGVVVPSLGATYIRYNVNGRADIDFFAGAHAVYFSNTPSDASGDLFYVLQLSGSSVTGPAFVYVLNAPDPLPPYIMPAGKPLGTSLSPSAAFDGKNWVAITKVSDTEYDVVTAPTLTDAMSAGIPGASISASTLTYFGTGYFWEKVVWTGRVFFLYAGAGTLSHYSTSENGKAWKARLIWPHWVIRDICFTPNTIPLTSSSAYTRYFLSSDTIFSGSLTANDYVQATNISAKPIQILGSPGSNSADLQLNPQVSSDGGETTTATVYSNGSFLFPV